MRLNANAFTHLSLAADRGSRAASAGLVSLTFAFMTGIGALESAPWRLLNAGGSKNL